MTRRDEYAQATRQAILDAARQLFAERGYFATKVDDIAARARVAPATVYAVTGGKYGLLSELIRIWTTDPIVEATTAQFGEMTDAVAIIRELAAGSRRMREQYEDIMRVMLATAPHDQAVAAALQTATSVYRKAFIPIAQRLVKLRALRRGVDVAYAVDLLWFYLATRRTSRCTTTTAGLTSARSIGWRTKLAASCYPNPVDAKADAGHPRSSPGRLFPDLPLGLPG
jgi:AcrR family transcriptional regulator